MWAGREAHVPKQVLPRLRRRVEETAYPRDAQRFSEKLHVQRSAPTVRVVLCSGGQSDERGGAASLASRRISLIAQDCGPEEIRQLLLPTMDEAGKVGWILNS